MTPRHTQPEEAVGIEQPGGKVKGVARYILLRNGVVGALMVIVLVGDEHVGTLERLVDEPRLHTYRKLPLEKLQFIRQLGSYIQMLVKAVALLLHHKPRAEPFADKFERHVGGHGKGLRRIVDAEPLQARVGPQFQKIGSAGGRGIVEIRQLVVLRQLGVGLGRCRQAYRRRHQQRQQPCRHLIIYVGCELDCHCFTRNRR